MELIKDIKKDSSNKSEIELVERQKQEYKLIGSFIRTKCLKLYSFNPKDESLFEVDIKKGETIHVEIENNKFKLIDKELKKTTVDTRFIYFEALRYASAKERVKKFRNNLNAMCNIREWTGINSIKIF